MRRMTATALLVLFIGFGTTGCDLDGILEVENPDVVTPEQLSGPTGIPNVVAGVVGNFQESFGEFTWFTALFTDEIIHAGTFGGWHATDDRRMTPDLTAGNWTITQVARQFAEDAIVTFQEASGNPEFEGVRTLLQRGLALAHFYGGYQHVLMAEFFCEMVIEPAGPAATPEEALDKGIRMLEEAETQAAAIGRGDVATAARIGQARANLQLGNYAQAANLVSGVPDNFLYVAEYSSNSPAQENFVFQLSYGINSALRASVGDGTQAGRFNERWPHFDEWVAQGLVDPNPNLTAFEASIRVQVQKLHANRDSDIHLASGWEARMIEAEALLRTGQTQAAEDLVNSFLATDDQSINPMSMLNSNLSLGAFQPVALTGNLSDDLPQLARARAAGLWLSTDRQATLRRYKVLDGVDLYPPNDPGDEHCFPIDQSEFERNPNLTR